ncbi:MAG: trehalose-phosphatase [Oxalobacter formigenes]|nr:trehalose-phosphatase [Oxalobacter formigenes]
MKPLFSQAGKKQLDKIIRPGVLCAFDFDGTLSPITDNPVDAYLPVPVGKRLLALSCLTPVAILTGRAIRDIRNRLPFSPAFLIGNHGLEGFPGKEALLEGYKKDCLRWEACLRCALSSWNTADPGIVIENKQYSLDIHYRHTPNPVHTGKKLALLLAAVFPDAHILPGKFTYSLLPQNAPDKGDALSALIRISGATGAIYAGDDTTDETVFRLRLHNLLSVRVGICQYSAAAWHIDNQKTVTHLLDTLISRLSPTPPLPEKSAFPFPEKPG